MKRGSQSLEITMGLIVGMDHDRVSVARVVDPKVKACPSLSKVAPRIRVSAA